MIITMATDWAIRRSAQQTLLFLALIEQLQYSLFMGKHDDRERIVNTQGVVVSRWKN